MKSFTHKTSARSEVSTSRSWAGRKQSMLVNHAGGGSGEARGLEGW